MDLSGVMNLLGEPLTLTAGALLIGALFGAASQRSRLCLRSAVIDLTRMGGRDGDWGKALGVFLLAYGGALATTQGLIAAGVLDVGEARQLASAYSLSGPLIGGLVFGAGMVLTRGCPGRLLVLSANGNLRAVFTLGVFGLAAFATYGGLFAPLKTAASQLLRLPAGSSLNLLAGGGLGPAGGVAIGGLVVALAIAFLPRLRAHAGAAIAALAAGLAIGLGWWFTHAFSLQAFEPVALESVNFTKSAVELTGVAVEGLAASKLTFGIALIGGVLAGSGLAGLVTREMKLQWFPSWWAVARYGVGAGAMGFGSVLAGGCAIGAGLTGNAIFAAGPIFALGAMVAGAAAMIVLFAWLEAACIPLISPCEETTANVAAK